MSEESERNIWWEPEGYYELHGLWLPEDRPRSKIDKKEFARIIQEVGNGLKKMDSISGGKNHRSSKIVRRLL